MSKSKDVFKIEGPALISFSGGRTSAYMLWRIVQAWGGTLPDDVKVTFANTGKEMPETLNFVHECAEKWGVEIVWLERQPGTHGSRFKIVNYETASRNGEPYKTLIVERQYLPNPVTRFCTSELKIRVMRDYARSLSWQNWNNVIGLRADEPQRVSRAKKRNDCWDNEMPLADAGISKKDVHNFWKMQNWGLMLASINGTTPLGNCDLCFLKSAATIQGIMRNKPELAEWWIEAEAEAKALASKPSGAVFRKDRPSYKELLSAVKNQRDFDFGDVDKTIDCLCMEDAT